VAQNPKNPLNEDFLGWQGVVENSLWRVCPRIKIIVRQQKEYIYVLDLKKYSINQIRSLY